MDDTETDPGMWQRARAWLGGFAPVTQAAAGAAALTFLFAAIMPLAWVGGIAWNLYLDRLGSWFEPPVGGAGRLVLAVGLALIAGLIAALVALTMARPSVDADEWGTVDFTDRGGEDDRVRETTRRRRVDHHPDAPPRPPIRAASDLPAEGLGPVSLVIGNVSPDVMPDRNEPDAAVEEDMLNLSLADRAPPEAAGLPADEDAPSAMIDPPPPAPAGPLPGDATLGAMVARFEVGLDRRRESRRTGSDAAREDGEPVIDFALEAALSTLQRMARSAVG